MLVFSSGGSDHPTFSKYESRARSAVTEVFAYISATISIPLNAILNFGSAFYDVINLREQYIFLKQENAMLKYNISQLNELKKENIELYKLSNFASRYDFEYTTARVVGSSVGGYGNNVIILAGTNHGVRTGQAVINHEGLVGRVIEANKDSARVMLITDMNSRIPAISEHSRVHLVASGNNSRTLSLLHVSEDNHIHDGELITSTDDGGFLPPGILLGTIKDRNGYTEIVPAADPANLDYLAVIKY